MSVFFLRNAGHDVTYIADGLKSISDVSVMQLAIQEQGIIITFDRNHGELIFKHNYKPPQGVIYLRLMEFQPDELVFFQDLFFGPTQVQRHNSERKMAHRAKEERSIILLLFFSLALCAFFCLIPEPEILTLKQH
ncbi:MAG: DUF5615 family PIN-like protein [Flavisolibacter sp.]|nr:DUF5615 family PIN-like protein [Flavisolibacter sp.]